MGTLGDSKNAPNEANPTRTRFSYCAKRSHRGASTIPEFTKRSHIESRSAHFAKRTVMAPGGTQPHENGVWVFYAWYCPA
jgi:hypothetical protein